jgi:hypothetical protein
MMDVFILKCAAPDPEAQKPSPDHAEAWAAVVSLPAGDASRLAARGKALRWEDLAPLVTSGGARIPAWLGAGGLKGSLASMARYTETPVPTKAAAHQAGGGLVFGTNFTFHTLGERIELTLPTNHAAAFDGKLSADFGKPNLPELPVLVDAAKHGTLLPGFSPATTVFPAEGDVSPLLEFNHPQIVRMAPCSAAKGNPEHGRWHAVVLIVREG